MLFNTRKLSYLLLIFISLCPHIASAYVVTSNKPLAMIVAAAIPSEKIKVLVDGQSTSHDYHLKPSDIKRIQNADLIVWAGPNSDIFLTKQAQKNPSKWIDVSQYIHSKEHSLHHGVHNDEHVWFHPDVAVKLYHQIRKKYSAHQLPHAYPFEQLLTNAIKEGRELLSLYKEDDYIVYHPAYQYWQEAIGIKPGIAITVSPDVPVSFKKIKNIKSRINDIHCFVQEPSSNKKVVALLLKDTDIQLVSIDPMAHSREINQTSYIDWYRSINTRMENCLKGSTSGEEE
jgi:zinc transport system substrate-binding protein